MGGDTLLAQIVAMVAKAQRSQAPIQRLADRVAAWFVPAVIAIALIAFAAWAMIGPQPRLAYGFVAARNGGDCRLSLCPGTGKPRWRSWWASGRGAGMGVLIKNAQALERLEKVDTLVVDKTGTLTEGKPRLIAVIAGLDVTEKDVIRLAASVETASEHPLAKAIVAAAAERAIAIAPVTGFDSPAGKGVVGMVENRHVVLGNAAFLNEWNIPVTALEEGAGCVAPGRRDRDLSGSRRARRRAYWLSPIR